MHARSVRPILTAPGRQQHSVCVSRSASTWIPPGASGEAAARSYAVTRMPCSIGGDETGLARGRVQSSRRQDARTAAMQSTQCFEAIRARRLCWCISRRLCWQLLASAGPCPRLVAVLSEQRRLNRLRNRLAWAPIFCSATRRRTVSCSPACSRTHASSRQLPTGTRSAVPTNGLDRTKLAISLVAQPFCRGIRVDRVGRTRSNLDGFEVAWLPGPCRSMARSGRTGAGAGTSPFPGSVRIQFSSKPEGASGPM